MARATLAGSRGTTGNNVPHKQERLKLSTCPKSKHHVMDSCCGHTAKTLADDACAYFSHACACSRASRHRLLCKRSVDKSVCVCSKRFVSCRSTSALSSARWLTMSGNKDELPKQSILTMSKMCAHVLVMHCCRRHHSRLCYTHHHHHNNNRHHHHHHPLQVQAHVASAKDGKPAKDIASS
eukprot:6487016-Amphidinium_carterae.1